MKEVDSEKPKRVCCRPGDVFCVDVKGLHRRYFQFLGIDTMYLGGRLIRVFKTRYPISCRPIINEIVRDEVDFYHLTWVNEGVREKYWYRVGTSKELGNIKDIFFLEEAFNTDSGKYSENWKLRKVFTLISQYVGKLPVQYQTFDIAAVVPSFGICKRIIDGYPYHPKAPKFFKEQERPGIFHEHKEIDFLRSVSRQDRDAISGRMEEIRSRDKFKYCLKVLTRLEELEPDRRPTDCELAVVNKLEDVFDYIAKGPDLENPNGEYVGRIISNGEMLSMWMINDSEKVESSILDYIQGDRYLRHFDYRID